MTTVSDSERICSLEEKIARAIQQLKSLDDMNVQKLIEGRGIDQAPKTRSRIATVIRDLEYRP